MNLLIASIIISLVNAYQPLIIKNLAKLFVQKGDKSAYKEQIKQTWAELETLSVRQDFPKYARLKRKLTKLASDNNKEEKAYQELFGEVSSKISYVFHGVMTALSLILFWMFRFQSVIHFPEEWLYPMENVLSWPMQSAGDISFPVWFLVTNSVSKIMANSFNL